MIAIHPLRLTFRSDAALTLPQPPGALWRGALGQRLRRDVCITGAAECAGCPFIARCDYGRLFEPLPPHSGVGRHFREPPRPWILAPGSKRRVRAGETLNLDITLTGTGLRAWPSLGRALERLELGPAHLELIDAQSRPPAPAGIAPRTELTGEHPVPPPCPDAVRVRLCSPLRLQRQGRPIGPPELDAYAFIAALLRRLDALGAAEVATQEAPQLLAHVRHQVWLANALLDWQKGERTSHSQGQRVPMGGIVGDFHLRGGIEPLWPWLWTGQWTHIGKSAVMGLGRYELEAA